MPPAPQETSKKKVVLGGLGARLIGGIVVFAVIGGGYWVYDQLNGGADTAKVGDCMQNNGTMSSPDLTVVNCSDTNAKYKVVKVISGTDINLCQGVPGVDTGYSQSGGRYTSDVVLCLASK